jgi:hypothetical protein
MRGFDLGGIEGWSSGWSDDDDGGGIAQEAARHQFVEPS